jgi:ribonuclease III
MCYDKALTHGSYNRELKENDEFRRLSFLGNYVIDFVIPDYVYRHYQNAQPGDMKPYTELTRNGKLAKLAANMELGVNEAIRIGDGTELTDDIKADAFEAFIAALYLHVGMLKVSEIFIPLFKNEIEKLDSMDPEERKTWKNRLGEFTQEKWAISPNYEFEEKIDQQKRITWIAKVFVNGEIWGEGEGRKKEGIDSASDNAAKNAFEKYFNE